MADEYLKKPMPSKKKQEDFYYKLRKKVQNWVDSKPKIFGTVSGYVLFAPDLFHLLTRLMLDSRIDSKSKAAVGAGIMYFIAPIDFLPELLIGPAGFLDDVVVAVFVINTILNKFPAEVITEHWTGDEDLLAFIKKVSNSSNKYVSKLPAGRLVKRFMK
ncbi:DUF1232 domain-containing protein [Planococcus sp. ISL-110]|uniref:YkvA family protein n=1 Tax=Planococcus sp. ISL-110 TaxID=2819167 RepID=UPI001BE892B4|nr:DUF1232 domain-containing protein [Planococcus sp. ISL-110]MBT2571443.1 DUF1232 domain-containing protein [Planococcus sp. ISL-110]